MAVKGFPDRERHKICIRCGQWFEPKDGIMVYTEAAGTLDAFRKVAARMAGDETAARFLCHKCHRVRRRGNAVLVILFMLICAAIAVVLITF